MEKPGVKCSMTGIDSLQSVPARNSNDILLSSSNMAAMQAICKSQVMQFNAKQKFWSNAVITTGTKFLWQTIWGGSVGLQPIHFSTASFYSKKLTYYV